MEARAIRTRALIPPQDDLLQVIEESVEGITNESVLAVSSKVVAIWQGRCVPIPRDPEKAALEKERLIKAEAEFYLTKDDTFKYSRLFTIYEGVFGSSSGIDESNGNGYYVLLPKNSKAAAEAIHLHLMERFSLSSLGVLIVDSRTQPMRNGVVGVSLGHAGFHALCDYRGEEDIFGRKLRFERLNTADCLASSATLLMGEGSETTPLVTFTDVPHLVFGTDVHQDPLLRVQVPMEEDVFAQFLMSQPWKCGGGYNETHGT